MKCVEAQVGLGGSPQGPALGRDGTWNRPRAARLPIGACHSCPRAGGQPTLEGHHAMVTDGLGGAARSLKPAAIVCVVSPALAGAVPAGTECLQFLRNNNTRRVGARWSRAPRPRTKPCPRH